MNINEIIIKPIITEKSSADLHVNRYTFEVNKLATKTDIKRAVETIFAKSNAKVSRVNISNLKPRNKKVGRYSGRTKWVKKAIITLSAGTIPIYGSEGIENEAKAKKVRQIIDTDKIMAEAEKEN